MTDNDKLADKLADALATLLSANPGVKEPWCSCCGHPVRLHVQGRCMVEGGCKYDCAPPPRCATFTPDHNGECLGCDEWADAHDALAQAQPNDLCATCRHPARNHAPDRCRKKRCGCGRFSSVPPP